MRTLPPQLRDGLPGCLFTILETRSCADYVFFHLVYCLVRPPVQTARLLSRIQRSD